MALCNIVGDLCYLGFAFDAAGVVSLPKLAGAAFTMAAHTVLLAYGDDQARHIAAEKGLFAGALLRLRAGAQRALLGAPDGVRRLLRVKPVGVSFAMLSLNGAGLLADALQRAGALPPWTVASQVALGCCIVAGCLAFAAADFVRGQKAADVLVKLAPSILALASASSWSLAAATLNPFLIVSVAAFGLSNTAGFFTRIEKRAAR
ncbi:MAG: hypothetical protein GC201_07155 [Alphaproteobacteria bacterium]|nr:hypothetical protein [Alphaproteobacteria bacterium]